MKKQLDMNKIAKRLGAKSRTKVHSSGGYFGAMQLLSDIESRLRVPTGGGRATDPRWTERRLVPLASRTLAQLERLTSRIQKDGIRVDAMQLAALLLENATEQLSQNAAEKLVRPRRQASR